MAVLHTDPVYTVYHTLVNNTVCRYDHFPVMYWSSASVKTNTHYNILINMSVHF